MKRKVATRQRKVATRPRSKPMPQRAPVNAQLAVPQTVIMQSGHAKPLTSEDIELLKQTVAKGTSDNEFKLFLWVCTKHKLDPFTRQIHCIMRWVKKHHQDEKGVWIGGHQMTIQMGIDGYRALAARDHSDYGGCDEPYFEFGSETVPGTKKLIPIKATINLWKKGFEHPTVGVAYWDEYAPDLDSENGFFWRKMPKGQLAKCAEALALRKAYPELSDIYTNEEMDQQNSHTPAGRQIIEDGRQLAGGSTEAARAVAHEKLDAHAAGKPMTEMSKAAASEPEPAPVAAKVEEQKAKAAASIKNKTVEYYPEKLGDMEIVIFVKNEAFALLLDEGAKEFTAHSDRMNVRYMPDDATYGEKFKALCVKLGLGHKRIAKPVEPSQDKPGSWAAPKAQIPPMEAPTTTAAAIEKHLQPVGGTGQREAVSDRTASQPQTTGQAPQTHSQTLKIMSCKRVPGKKGEFLAVKWGNEEYIAFDKALWPFIEGSIGQNAMFEFMQKQVGAKTYRNIVGIKRIGNREYEDNTPVRTREDGAQTSLY